jgi:hypothetical protein
MPNFVGTFRISGFASTKETVFIKAAMAVLETFYADTFAINHILTLAALLFYRWFYNIVDAYAIYL